MNKFWRKKNKPRKIGSFQYRLQIPLSYEERDEIIKKMGFKSYCEYLKSDVWDRIRTKVISENKDCLICGGFANQIHHVKYTRGNLFGFDRRYLISVCQSCHYKIEFDENGNKLSLKDSQNKIRWYYKV